MEPLCQCRTRSNMWKVKTNCEIRSMLIVGFELTFESHCIVSWFLQCGIEFQRFSFGFTSLCWWVGVNFKYLLISVNLKWVCCMFIQKYCTRLVFHSRSCKQLSHCHSGLRSCVPILFRSLEPRSHSRPDPTISRPAYFFPQGMLHFLIFISFSDVCFVAAEPSKVHCKVSVWRAGKF